MAQSIINSGEDWELLESFLGQKYGFLFQGMGVDYRGFAQRFDAVQKEILHAYCNRVQKTIQVELWDYLLHSGGTGDDSLFHNWVAIYTTDCLIYDEMCQLGLQPGLFMGYSMGLITALACGKAISFETGLDLLRSTWEYLQYPRMREEGMATIIGLTHQDITELIHQGQMVDEVEIASENNEHCIVISGLRESVAKLMEIALNEGALKVKDLNSPYAIHSQYAILHIDKFIKDVAKATVKSCSVPLVSTLHQEVLESGFDLKIELVQNMFTPMNWKAALVKAETLGICDFIEVSFDNSLTKVSKLVNPHYRFLNYDKVIKLNWPQTGQGNGILRS